MKQRINTTGIVLARTEFQEADRILTVLTPDHGKVRLIAKGVRRPKSKLAGGIELFSVSEIGYLPRSGQLHTLVSSRLQVHYGSIVKDIRRTMLGYELLRRINRATEDVAEEFYFDILNCSLEGLNDLELPCDLTELWFMMQLLRIAGHTPNMRTDIDGKALQSDQRYVFHFDEMTFRAKKDGPFTAAHIKILRLAFSLNNPIALGKVQGIETVLGDVLKLAQHIYRLHIRS